jgi:hypothetical protein
MRRGRHGQGKAEEARKAPVVAGRAEGSALGIFVITEAERFVATIDLTRISPERRRLAGILTVAKSPTGTRTGGI